MQFMRPLLEPEFLFVSKSATFTLPRYPKAGERLEVFNHTDRLLQVDEWTVESGKAFEFLAKKTEQGVVWAAEAI